ncbi:MAG: DNA methyltransferase, partial [bacterium]
AMDRGLPGLLPLVGPWQLYGIEKNPYAFELAQMTVWIGYLQWLRQHGTTTWKEPVLQAMSNIEHKDAILDLIDPENPKEPTWPAVDFIVSNPPFLGSQLMRSELGSAYVESLRELYGDRLPGQADLCCYWFEKARSSIEGQGTQRAGLLATQGIRGGGNRRVLERIKESGQIFWAWSDRDWILDGANVHVSMVGFDAGAEETKSLDGHVVETINSDLTSGVAATRAVRLAANRGLAFQGPVKVGAFDIEDGMALEMLETPNPNGRPSSDVIVPWVNGLDITRRARCFWLLDFGERVEGDAAKYELPFQYVAKTIRPERVQNADRQRRELWWRLGRSGGEWKIASGNLKRALFTARVAKHRLFVWSQLPTMPDTQVVAVAVEAEASFGILHSRVHEVWSLAQGTQLEDRPRYTPTTCFETFPFPSMKASDEVAIGAVAKELDELRKAWLNPPEWTREEVLEFPGSVDGPWKRFVHAPDAKGIGTVRWPRIVAKDAECAAKLVKRTLTNLYNERPTWLDNAHRKLDEAVFAVYGWPPDLTGEQILERLLALNLERAAAEEKSRG